MPDNRFDPVAPIYARARPEYPRELYQLLTAEHGGIRFASAVDMGCGAGQSLAGLLEIAGEVTGIEPADAMRQEARQRFPRARLVDAGAQCTGLPAESADLVTIATAFYWMEAAKVLTECARLLTGDGLLAIYAYGFPGIGEAGDAVLEKHLEGRWDAFRSERLKRPDDTAARIAEQPELSYIRHQTVRFRIDWTTAQVVDFLHSTSYVSAFLASIGERNSTDYLLSLGAELEQARPGDAEVIFDLSLHLARRLPRDPAPS